MLAFTLNNTYFNRQIKGREETLFSKRERKVEKLVKEIAKIQPTIPDDMIRLAVTAYYEAPQEPSLSSKAVGWIKNKLKIAD